MNLIWATRGRTWGFRFLMNGGLADPLPTYEIAFAGLEEEFEVCRSFRDGVALRFSDPEDRRDKAGRVIPHDFVVFGSMADGIESVDDGVELIWHRPEIGPKFSSVWDLADLPMLNK